MSCTGNWRVRFGAKASAARLCAAPRKEWKPPIKGDVTLGGCRYPGPPVAGVDPGRGRPATVDVHRNAL